MFWPINCELVSQGQIAFSRDLNKTIFCTRRHFTNNWICFEKRIFMKEVRILTFKRDKWIKAAYLLRLFRCFITMIGHKLKINQVTWYWRKNVEIFFLIFIQSFFSWSKVLFFKNLTIVACIKSTLFCLQVSISRYLDNKV